MSSNYEDALMDFDLNFLHESSSNEENGITSTHGFNFLNSEQHKFYIKKIKTIATDSLIRKYYLAKEALKQNEKNLLESKEQCKKVYINLQKTLEKNAQMETDLQAYKSRVEQLDETCLVAENKHKALQSHINQLQMLVKEHEGQIESLKIENCLEKANVKERDKKVYALQNEITKLLKHVYLAKDIILGKKKLNRKNKMILQKYETSNPDASSDESDYSFGDADIFENVKSPSPVGSLNKEPMDNEYTGVTTDLQIGKEKEGRTFKEFIDCASECGNEIASEDTGCGSSLAFSGSPYYSIEGSPPNYTQSKSVAHIATSPITILSETATKASSPIIFEELICDKIKATYEISTNTYNEKADKAVSPINIFERINSTTIEPETINTASSPIMFENLNSEKVKETLETASNTDTHDGKTDTSISSMRMVKLIDPMTLEPETANAATSPIMFECHNSEKIKKMTEKAINTVTSHVDKALSPNRMVELINISKSPIFTTTTTNDNMSDSSSKSQLTTDQRLQEKQCLEQNNSKNACHDINNDVEIERILNVMTIHHDLITPLPTTPSKLQEVEKMPVKLETKICSEVEKIKKQNKILHFNVSHLMKEIVGIKSILKKKLILDEDSFITDTNIIQCDPLENSELFDENSFYLLDNGIEDNDSVYSDQSIHIESDIQAHDKVSKPIERENEQSPKLSIEKRLLFEDPLPVDHEKEPPVENGTILQVNEMNTEEVFRQVLSDDSEQLQGDNVRCQQKILRNRKLTRLEKFRKRLAPRGKIRKPTPSTKKMLLKSEMFRVENKMSNYNIKAKPASAGDTSLTLNDKSVYEKAIRVMAELNANRKPNNMHAKPVNIKDHAELLDETNYNTSVDVALSEAQAINTNHMNDKNIEDFPTKDISMNAPGPTNSQKMNDKSVNEEAIKVMAEMKGNTKPIVTDKPVNIKNRAELLDKTIDVAPSDTQTINNNHISVKNTEVLPTKDISINAGGPTISLITLNDKSVNEKAIRVMAELKGNTKPNVNPIPVNIKKHAKLLDKENNSTSVDFALSKTETINNNHITDENLVDRPTKDVSLNVEGHTNEVISDPLNNSNNKENTVTSNVIESPTKNRKRRRNTSSPVLEIQNKRVLRSTTLRLSVSENTSMIKSPVKINKNNDNLKVTSPTLMSSAIASVDSSQNIQNEKADTRGKYIKHHEKTYFPSGELDPKESMMCKMVEKFGRNSINKHKKIPVSVTNDVSKEIEMKIAKIVALGIHTREDINNTVKYIKSLKLKHFLSGLMAYLKDPTRRVELYKTVNSPPAPPMTKSERVLLSIISILCTNWFGIDLVNDILLNIEYTLFAINRTPDFGIIESMSHFYAVLCRYQGNKTRLRVFMLDAMYCIQYKSVPLIKQCLDAWPHILPLAHMSLARTPLVTCLVYLLHFFKCEDKFKRVQEMRNILYQKYSYKFTDWSEMQVLDMIKRSINEIRDNALEKKMLRFAIILLAKRHGAKWCQKKLVKNILLPMVEKEDITENVKQFCVSILGALLKPYPVDMKIHCEIVMNLLMDMLSRNDSQEMQEAIFTSLINISKHNQTRVVSALLAWRSRETSAEFQSIIKDFIREKPIKSWKKQLSQLPMNQ